MNYKQLKALPDKDFMRCIGVSKETFNDMVDEAKKEMPAAKTGRKRKLSIEEEVFIMLYY